MAANTKLTQEQKETVKVYADLMEVKLRALKKGIESADAREVLTNATVVASVSRWVKDAVK